MGLGLLILLSCFITYLNVVLFFYMCQYRVHLKSWFRTLTSCFFLWCQLLHWAERELRAHPAGYCFSHCWLPLALSFKKQTPSSNSTRQLYSWTSPDSQYEIRLIIFFAAEDGETVYNQEKRDQELTVAQIINSLLQKERCHFAKKGSHSQSYVLLVVFYPVVLHGCES